MKTLAANFGPADFLVSCAADSGNMLNGGNQWSGWPAWLSFFRHVVKLDESHGLDYSKWDHYEVAALAGPRYMHPEFCLVSEPPLELTVDDRNRPHRDDGPFCRWADGSRIYAFHGQYVPGWILERPDLLTVEKIKAEPNAEIRRVMVEKYGPSRYLIDAGAKFLDVDGGLGLDGSASRALFEDADGQRWLVGTDGSTGRVYHMPAPRETATCKAAHEWMAGFDESLLVAEA
jgi:hypothetical protein